LKTDPFFGVHLEAEHLLSELKIDTLPIDPFKIAKKLDIELKPLPATAGGASGMLLHINGMFGICYPTHIDNVGFKNFSVGHEIGHYRLPGHIDAVIDASGRHVSNAGFRSDDRYEKEADQFSASLLMPKKLFLAAGRRAGDGLNAIERLSNICITSLEATAIRFAETNRDPVVVIVSKGPSIEYAVMSEPFKEISGLDWIRKGTPLPPGCATADFNSDKENVLNAERSDGSTNLQDWFNGPYNQDIYEEVIGLGSYGKTITVLTEIESPEDFDDDEDWEEKWTPRFRR